MATESHAFDRYIAEYAIASRVPPRPAWLGTTSMDAFNRFLSLGFPTTRDEEWRFTSVRPIAEHGFLLPTARSVPPNVDEFRLPGAVGAELVFVDGLYAPALSRVSALFPGVRAVSLASTLRERPDELEPYLARLASFERQAFIALNTALIADGAYIRIPAHTVVEQPIHVLFVSTDGDRGQSTRSHPRVLAVVGEHSQASLVETYAGAGGVRYFTNAVTEISLGENAVLSHVKHQYESEEAYHVGAMHVAAGRGANFMSHSISLGGALVRNDVTATLDGEGVECTLNGLYLADGQRHVDNHTTIDHAQAHCASRELYKGILADRARGVFNGKIIVRPDAQKTDAKQTNRALLLSEDAQINTKPQLEIFANDVKCTHGAAVGQLDQDAVFYLRSRGLSALQARHMLVQAFVGEVLQRIPSEPIRTNIEEVVARALTARLAA